MEFCLQGRLWAIRFRETVLENPSTLAIVTKQLPLGIIFSRADLMIHSLQMFFRIKCLTRWRSSGFLTSLKTNFGR